MNAHAIYKCLVIVFPDFSLYLGSYLGIFPEKLLDVFPALSDSLVIIRKPRSAFVHDIKADATSRMLPSFDIPSP